MSLVVIFFISCLLYYAYSFNYISVTLKKITKIIHEKNTNEIMVKKKR